MNKPKKNNELQKYFKDFNMRQCMGFVNVIVLCVIFHCIYLGLSSLDSIKTPLYYKGMGTLVPDNSSMLGRRLSTWATVQYKDVVYYQSPFFTGKKVAERRIIGRVIGLPGDTIEIKSGVLYRNNHILSEEYIEKVRFSDSYAPMIVPRDHIYILLDNRGLGINSKTIHELDSRHLGLVMGNFVEGKWIGELFNK